MPGNCSGCGHPAAYGLCPLSGCGATVDIDGHVLSKGDTFYVMANGRQGKVQGIGSPGLLTVTWDDQRGDPNAVTDAIYSQYVMLGPSPTPRAAAHGRVTATPKTCRRCGAVSQGGAYCPNLCGRI